MEEGLISKKELLERTDISYGQLYRWKRKNLIPEDWFIRKSTFTGQETFFPTDKILARIDKIKHKKDDLSLDELADMLSPNPTTADFKKEEIIKRNIVSAMALDLFIEDQGDAEVFAFEQLLYLYVLEKLLQTGEISLEEGKVLLQALVDYYPNFLGKNCDLVFVRKLGIATCMLISTSSQMYLENGARVVVRLSLANCIEELKLKIN